MPDSFSKTIPIWTAVINRSLFPEMAQFHSIHCPQGVLDASEVSQIEQRLDAFVADFRSLNLDQQMLRDTVKLPLKVHWVTQEDFDVPVRATNARHLILCSASKRISGTEMSAGGYIQGAGDDGEAWASGLTPDLYWTNREQLLSTPDPELPEIITTLLLRNKGKEGYGPIMIRPTTNLFIGTQHDESQSNDSSSLTIYCHGAPQIAGRSTVLALGCDSGKNGSRDLRRKLNQVKNFVSLHFRENADRRLYVRCQTGTDLSIGVALVILCLFYNETGMVHDPLTIASSSLTPEGQYVNPPAQAHITKAFIRPRLAWIISSKPDTNPSRSTLQAVNSFLMERPP